MMILTALGFADLSGIAAAIALIAVLALLVVLYFALSNARRLARLETCLTTDKDGERLQRIHELVARAADDRGEFDRHRLERDLGEVSGGVKRLETLILGVLEQQAKKPTQTEGSRTEPSLRERVTVRLLTLGYTDILIVTGPKEMAELQANELDGVVVVEVREGPAQLKGRVVLEAGVITDIVLTPFYRTFP